MDIVLLPSAQWDIMFPFKIPRSLNRFKESPLALGTIFLKNARCFKKCRVTIPAPAQRKTKGGMRLLRALAGNWNCCVEEKYKLSSPSSSFSSPDSAPPPHPSLLELLQPTARLEVVQSGPISMLRMHKAIKGQWPEIFCYGWLKVHESENFFGFDFEICTFS
jgi:hypothetical protein